MKTSELESDVLDSLLKRDPTHVFSREYCEIFKNSFFIEHLLPSIMKDLAKMNVSVRRATGNIS